MFFTRQIRLGVLLLAFAVFLSWSGARSLVVVHGKILLVFCGSRSLEALDLSSSRLFFFGGIFFGFFFLLSLLLFEKNLGEKYEVQGRLLAGEEEEEMLMREERTRISRRRGRSRGRRRRRRRNVSDVVVCGAAAAVAAGDFLFSAPGLESRAARPPSC